jgi:hypothetical protein
VKLSVTNYSSGEHKTDVIVYDGRFACACDLTNDYRIFLGIAEEEKEKRSERSSNIHHFYTRRREKGYNLSYA